MAGFQSRTPEPQFRHHDHFVGIMQRQHIAETEESACKWLGKTDDELTYSYNGVHWNRTDRQAFIPRPQAVPRLRIRRLPPLSGDHAGATPVWTDGNTAAGLVGKHVRLQFTQFQAQLYSIHWDFAIQYGTRSSSGSSPRSSDL